MSKAQQKTDTKTPIPEKQDKASANKAEAKTKPSPAKTTASSKGGNTPPKSSDTPPKRGNGIAIGALVIAIGAFAIGYQASQQIGSEKDALNQRINNTEKNIAAIEASSESSRSIAETAQSTNQLLQKRLEAIEASGQGDGLDEKLASLNETISGLDGKTSSLDEKVTGLNEKISSLDERFGGLDGQLSGLDEKITGLSDKLASSIAELQQSDTTISDSLSKLSDTISASKNDNLLVNGALHLINIANHQAQLNQDPNTAVIALEAANQQLQDADDPSLLEIRQMITDDISALRNITPPDISGTALALSQLEASVNGLPLSSKTAEPDASGETAVATEINDVSSFFNKVWSDVKGLVSIRHNAGQSAALLPPGQRFFLQQNLRLKLETARLALLQGDSKTFQSSLATAKEWVEDYFDTSATSTANLLTGITSYQALELNPALPDLSRSLKALEAWNNQQKAE